MNENRCVCCDAVIPEGYLVCPSCEKKEDLLLIGGGRYSGQGLAMAYREHDRYLEAKRARDEAIREKCVAQNERLEILKRLHGCVAVQVFPPLPGFRENAEKRIAQQLGEYLLATGMIQFTEVEDVYEDRSLMVLRGRVTFLQPKVEKHE